MRIAIVGAGGIGGYLAAKLTDAGTDVALVARGAHLKAMQANGLTLEQPEGTINVTPAILTDDTGKIGQPDVIILAVKGHQLADAIADVAPAVGPKTRLLPFQNGVDASDMIAAAFGSERTLTGVAMILSNITAPGVISRYGAARSFIIGDSEGAQAPVTELRNVLAAAGTDVPDHPDVRVALWEKFVLFNAGSSITAATRKRLGEIRSDPNALALARRLMEETEAVGRASGIELPADVVDKAYAVFTQRMPDNARTSTAHDLEEGRALEIDFICGSVARRGRELGLDVTASETIYAILSPWKNGS